MKDRPKKAHVDLAARLPASPLQRVMLPEDLRRALEAARKFLQTASLADVHGPTIGESIDASSAPFNGAQVIGQLRRVYAHAIEHGRWSGLNPASGFRAPRTRRREHPLDAAAARKLRVVLDDPEVGPKAVRLLCRFLLLSGWRIGEARRLRIEHVRARMFDEHRFAVIELPATKGGPQRRQVSGAALSTLLSASSGRTVGLVFEGVSEKMVRRALTAACAKAEVSRRVPHDLRHTFATYLLRRGVARADVSRLMGHVNERTTLGYSHAFSDDVRSALRLVDELDELEEETGS